MFNFSYIKSDNPTSMLHKPNASTDWREEISVKATTGLYAEDAVRGKFDFLVVPCHKPHSRAIFDNNNVVVLADRIRPITDADYWFNLMSCKAYIADQHTKDSIIALVPSLPARWVRGDGIVASHVHRIENMDYDPTEFFWDGSDDDFLLHKIKTAKTEAGLPYDINIKPNRERANNGILITPHAHSSIWLNNLAAQHALVVHPVAFDASYCLDPRSNSAPLGRLIQMFEDGMSGSTAFDVQMQNFLEELTVMVESLRVNKYVRPVGPTLFDRLYAEINRSSFS